MYERKAIYMQQVYWRRNAAIFLIGQGITLFGSMLVHYAIQWHITLTARSGVAMMLLSVSMALPMFLISPFAGVWADRYSKRMLIVAADAAIAVVTLLMAVLFSLGFEYIALLMLCTAARGFGQGVQMPAVNSLVPEIVPAESLTRVNGISSSIQSASGLLAPIAGGALIAVFPIQAVLYIDVVTAAIGIGMLLLFVKAPAKEKAAETQTAWREMALGLGYIKSHAFIKKLLIVNVLFNLLITPAVVLTPLQTVRDFGPEPWRLVAIEIVFFLGMAAGGGIIGVWGGFKNKSYTIAFAVAFFGISVIGLGLMEIFTLYLGFMGLAGVAMPVFNAPLMSMLQVKVDAEYMGRVMSVMMMLSSIIMPVGMTIWGPLADVVEIDLLLLVSGAGILGTGAFFILSKTLRHAGLFEPSEKKSA